MKQLGVLSNRGSQTTCALLAAALSISVSFTSEFIPLGDLPGGDNFSSAFDLSADGSTVLGLSSDALGGQIFLWKEDTGFTLLPPFDAQTISADGTVVAGTLFTDKLEAMRWSQETGLVQLGTPVTEPGVGPFGLALDISGDGSIVAGMGATVNSMFSEAILWTAPGSIVGLGFLPSDLPEPGYLSYSFANAISGNGQVVVGASASTKHVDRSEEAFRWTETEGMQPLGFLPGDTQSQAMAVTSDGSVVVGFSGASAFRWTQSDGMVSIGSFLPLALSADGNLVVGNASTDEGQVAYIWTAKDGALPLQAWLEQKHQLSAPDWTFYEAIGISEDGTKIAGSGVNPSGSSEAFLISLGSAEVVTTGTITVSGPVQPFVVDPSGRRYGYDPRTGLFHQEIPGLTALDNSGILTLKWSGLEDGTYQLTLNATGEGPYNLNFNFLHGDAQSSGKAFAGETGAFGVNQFSANISAATAAGSVFSHIYADSDGDGLTDSVDTNPNSDLRSNIFVGGTDTGLQNLTFENGVTVNDLLSDLLINSNTRSGFISSFNQLADELISLGVMSPNQKQDIFAAARNVQWPSWSAAKKN